MTGSGEPRPARRNLPASRGSNVVMAISLLLILLTMLPATPAAPAKDAARVPVVVELFTSEGCSSCPPADALLRDLEARQPIAGVEIIPLGFHVDYWDELGWKDRFSSAAYTRRQHDYGARFRLESVYTPQMVVGGRFELVGNDAARVLELIRQRAAAPRAQVELSRAADGALEIQVTGAAPGSRILVAVTEGSLGTSVRAGENRGRELRHTAVAHWLRDLGATRDAPFQARVALPVNGDWRRQNLRAVVWVQRPDAGEIVGAATLALR